jgi:F-type H+-transporting ATPase subunit alpha
MARSVLRIAPPYDEATVRSIQEGFAGLLGTEPDFEIVEDQKLLGGFVAVIGGKVYDASYSSLLGDAGKKLGRPGEQAVGSSFSTVGSVLRQRLREIELEPAVYEVGEVESCHDEIVQIKGLSHCRYGELLAFDSGAVGLTLDLHTEGVGAALLNGTVSTASTARQTGRVAEVIVGEELLGRVVDPLGRPLDSKGEIFTSKSRRIESPAPSIMDRAPVDTALETGILAIDSMIPIGRGQRELIIGDRQTGKTSIALSAIINQRGRGVLCVYCAIGQKASTVSGLVHTLSAAGAMENTVVVSADSSNSAAMQYIAPYAACAIAEEFMYSGRDVLVVYDDLSKHAVAYRAISLLLRRPSGREAYPGDVFYLHSRLLERSAKLSAARGGGSLTALPIVETLAGDISAYIPTNVISITDGQIYLESELFNAGMRPAINVGLSVSRVGRAAQHKAMSAVSGSLRLEVAQYREMAVFAQFGADLDAATSSMLKNGEKLMELLKQKQDQLFSLSEQTAILLAVSSQTFKDTDKHEIDNARTELLSFLHASAASVMNRIDSTGALTDEDRADLLLAFRRFASGSGVQHGRAE